MTVDRLELRPRGVTVDRSLLGRSVLCSALILLLQGTACGVASAPVRDSALQRCVAKWNRAPLGDGRRMAAVLAAAVPRHATAVVVRFTDGICGLVLSERQASAAGAPGQYVRALHGDYVWGQNPLDAGSQSQDPHREAAVARSGSRAPNVRLSTRKGTLVAVPRAHVINIDFPAIDRAAEEQPCPTIRDPAGHDYSVTADSVSCALTRTLVWAYNDHEGRQGSTPSTRTIIGWKCRGKRLAGEPVDASGDPDEISCQLRDRIVRVDTASPPVSGSTG